MPLRFARRHFPLWGIAAAFAALIFIATLVFDALFMLEMNVLAVTHTQDLLVALEETLSVLKDIAIEQRDYVLTGEPRHLTDVANAVDHAKAGLAGLSAHIRTPAQNSEVAEFRRVALGIIDDVESDLRTQSSRPGAGTAAIYGVREELSGIRSTYQRIKKAEEAHLAEMRRQAVASARTAGFALIGGGSLALGTLLLAFIVLKRQISYRERAEASARAREEEMRFIYEAITDITQGADAHAGLHRLLAKTCRFARWQYGQAWVLNPDSGTLHAYARWTGDSDARASHSAETAPQTIRLDESPFARALQTRSAVWCSNFSTSIQPGYLATAAGSGYRSWIAIPIFFEERLLAVIEFFDASASEQDERIVRLVSILATQAAPLLQRQKATEEIQALNTALEASNRELEGFAYSISHDLRAPLRSIDGFSLMIQSEYADRLGAAGARLVDDLLSFSKLGKAPLRMETIVMTDLLSEGWEYATSETKGSVRLEAGHLPQTFGDASLLSQVWVNLLSNAVKYSSRSPAPLVSVSGEQRTDSVVYCVRDNGVGFDMKYYDKLFGVFARLHSEDDFPGTGAGLAIVKRIVERHGGRIWAESSPGEGASFFFSLPAAAKDTLSALT